MSGQHGGVQALVKKQCPNALFTHCYAHKLNLVLAQGTSNVQAAKLFFADRDAFHNFFSSLCKSITVCSGSGCACTRGFCCEVEF